MLHPVVSVALGGALGSVLRYAVSMLCSHCHGVVYPLSTSIVNIVGCFVIGFITELSASTQLISADTKLFLTVGFCGGLTTFSTFCNENIALLRGGHVVVAIAYTVVSVALGLIAVYVGMVLARRI